MRCPKCEFDNPRGMKFCGKCRTSLALTCPNCSFENPPGFDFCGQCAAALNPPVSGPVFASTPVSASPVQPVEVVGERRHLTVLFCDLVGSTGIATRLDPEQWRETVAGYQRAAAEAITRFDGHVAKYLGDGVMAYFGWPAAHDNDAERAARAGLAILDAITKLNQQPGHAQLSARVGIDSGLVVIGRGAGNDAEVFGDVPNIAARVQATAEPGTVSITDATHRLVSGLFVVEDCGAQELKGVERPLQLYRVIRPSGMRGRFPAMAAMRGMTPFVGREDELRSLLNRWERVREGEGQVVTIIGEGGIGKSRLVQRFREELAATPYTWLECATAPFFQNTPFYAIADMLQQSFHWEPSHTTEQRLAALEASLALAGLDPSEAVPLIAPLLELPAGDRYPPLSMPPDQQRKRLLATLVGWTFGAAKAQPLVIATEDLHWADPSTLELIQLLVEQGAPARLLLLYTARPEFHAPWPMRAHHTQINLNRLTARHVRAMVAQVAAKIALADETVATVVERTGGVPLFVEELTRAVLESGEIKLTGREIPATLHDSLMARLDRLGPPKEVLQIGAVIGSEFSYELLCAVHPIEEAELQAALRKLADAELLYVRGIAPDATYQFKHALIRDAAYEALLKSRRKDLHRKIAGTIDENFPALKEAHPEVLARHWTEAGLSFEAIPYWKLAGRRAAEHSAHAEAIGHLTKGLELLHSLPESSERCSLEWEIQTNLGPALMASKGFGAPEVGKTYSRALELARNSKQGTESFPALWGLFAFYVTRSELQTARELGEQIQKAVSNSKDPDLLLAPHRALGQAFLLLGDQRAARAHLEQGVSLYSLTHKGDLALLYGRDPGVACLTYLAWSLWLLGYPEKAEQRNNESLALARELKHPFSLAVALVWAATIYQFLHDGQRTEKLAEAALTLSASEGGFAQVSAFAMVLRGWAWSQRGRERDGIALIHQGLAAYRRTGSEANRPMGLAYMAELYKQTGESDEGLLSISEALTLVKETGEGMYEAELYRLKGELLLVKNACDSDESERCYKTAIEISRKQSAKSWELRATISLARLLASQGRRDEARAKLAEIYAWFTEGFDTADLKDAKTLLEELST
jgi:class 3 adenylate cyclase/predicted ATPase